MLGAQSRGTAASCIERLRASVRRGESGEKEGGKQGPAGDQERGRGLRANKRNNTK